MTALTVELEKVYDDFCVIDEEYETLVSSEEHTEHQIVNGLDIPAYRANVNEAYMGARNAYMQAKASKTSSVLPPGSVSIPADPLTHPLDQSASLPVQGTSQPGNNVTLDQPATSVVTVSSQAQSATLSTSNAQANNFPLGIGSIYPSGYSVAPAPQYPLLQSSTQQPTVTNVYTGHLSSVLPQQSVSYATPAQSNGSQANDLTGLDPISSASFSIPSAQQYWMPHPFVQQSAGGQVYPGQLMNVSPYQPGSLGMPPQSSGASSVDTPGVYLKKMSLPTFSGERKDWPEFKTVWKQLAEGGIKNKTALAHELKRSVKGEASQRIKSVYVTKPEAYDAMWRKLEDYYNDTSATVQAALEDLHRLKPVSETDSRPFMKFLEREREAVAGLAEYQPRRRRTLEVPRTGDRGKGMTHHGIRTGQDKRQFYQCAFHRGDAIKHKTSDCKEFRKLPISGEGGKFELLKQVNACFVCFGNHPQRKGLNKRPCSLCGSEKHHFLLCKPGKRREGSNMTSQDQTGSAPRNAKEEDRKTDLCAHAESASHATRAAGLVLYPIQQGKVCESGRNVTIFCDGGSNTTYITHQAADRIKAKKLNRFILDVTTMGNAEKTYNTRQYQFTLRTITGKKVSITAFGMDKITGPVSKLDTKVLASLFPGYDVDSLQRRADKVDILLGCDYFGLFPKCEEAKCGENVSIMKGDFGVCLQGTHPDLKERTEHDSNLAKTIHNSIIKHEVYHICHDIHPEFQPDYSDPVKLVDIGEKNTSFRLQTNVAESFTGRNQGRLVENFIAGE